MSGSTERSTMNAPLLEERPRASSGAMGSAISLCASNPQASEGGDAQQEKQGQEKAHGVKGTR
jgi:hypothetical protein